MFGLAIFIGIYSYIIFFLGIAGFLTKSIIEVTTLVYFAVILFATRKSLAHGFKILRKIRFKTNKIYKNPISLFILLFLLQALVNMMGALGPELAFDALWYHLTLPKLYLLHHTIYNIPGGLLYYSDMPKLGEMLYIGALAFGNEITAKLIHFIFGILIAICLYKFSRKYFTHIVSVLIVVIFYSNLVVDWESITAYIDLIRTFFELMALWGFINWFESQKTKWLALSGVMIGLAITAKVLAFGSFLVFLLLIALVFINKRKSLKDISSEIFIYILCSVSIPLPWFIFSYINTGNPFYPFFSHIYEISANSPNPLQIIPNLWNLFMYSADPISPVYLIFIPFLFVFYAKFSKEMKIIVAYSGLSLLLWYFTPQTGGGRFILPYLPAFSIVCGAIYSEILKKKGEWRYFSKLLLFVVIFVSLISIGYRFLANSKYIPVIIGRESKQAFLSNQLNFHFGDFYDVDGYFVHIKPTDTVLLYGFHNLYYVDFPFIDETWIKKGDRFDYVATQNTKLPKRFADWQLIYSSAKTTVKLYKNKSQQWTAY